MKVSLKLEETDLCPSVQSCISLAPLFLGRFFKSMLESIPSVIGPQNELGESFTWQVNCISHLIDENSDAVGKYFGSEIEEISVTITNCSLSTLLRLKM